MNIYIYIYIYKFFFFGWFSNSWNEKKNVVLGSWATTHPLALGHDQMVCIVTGKAGRLAWA